mmetsp:Transcript_42154/g.119661  ORF Transcript_42154/g.119661 Transcript_42154/m.119661 type:complete len:84 (-) Transcript_42154:88-339(-)
MYIQTSCACVLDVWRLAWLDGWMEDTHEPPLIETSQARKVAHSSARPHNTTNPSLSHLSLPPSLPPSLQHSLIILSAFVRLTS